MGDCCQVAVTALRPCAAVATGQLLNSSARDDLDCKRRPACELSKRSVDIVTIARFPSSRYSPGADLVASRLPNSVLPIVFNLESCVVCCVLVVVLLLLALVLGLSLGRRGRRWLTLVPQGLVIEARSERFWTEDSTSLKVMGANSRPMGFLVAMKRQSFRESRPFETSAARSAFITTHLICERETSTHAHHLLQNSDGHQTSFQFADASVDCAFSTSCVCARCAH